VGTARPATRYGQDQLADLLAVPDGVGRRFFKGSGIEARYLYVAPTDDGRIPDEDQAQLLARHRRGALQLGSDAINRCLDTAGIAARDVDFLCCITSTGFMLPGLSAMYVRRVPFRQDCQRVDIVGMGCNAGLNGLSTVANWAAVNPDRHALLVCCEINSAIHVRDDRVVTSLVNSLFGDGCGAWLLANTIGRQAGPEILAFASYLVPDAWAAISYHWSVKHGKFELFLDKAIPQVLGVNSPAPISALLEAFDLRRHDVKHWFVHAGGKRVIGAVGDANGLTSRDLRHATSVLRDSGNMGSATVMFTYEESLKERVFASGEYGVMVTMGPGATIETALLRW
jgi:polyketide synthase Type III